MRWLHYKDKAISSNNDVTITSVTSWEDCAHRCHMYSSSESFAQTCASFDWDHTSDQCHLAQTADQHNASMITNTNFEHGENCAPGIRIVLFI